MHSEDSDLLVNAWYTGGIDVIDFNDPANPSEVAYWHDTSDNWSAYWYEGPSVSPGHFPVYGTDGVEDPATGEGFQVFSVFSDATADPLDHLNPQTQRVGARRPGRAHRAQTGAEVPLRHQGQGEGQGDPEGRPRVRHVAVAKHLAP